MHRHGRNSKSTQKTEVIKHMVRSPVSSLFVQSDPVATASPPEADHQSHDISLSSFL